MFCWLTSIGPSVWASSSQASSIQTSTQLMSVYTCYEQVEPWPFDWLMLVKTSPKNSAAVQAPLGSLTSMLMSLLLLQDCGSARLLTMSSTTLAPNLSIPVCMDTPGCWWMMLRMELPNTLTRWQQTSANWWGGNSMWPLTQRKQRSLVQGETRALVKANQSSLDWPHAGRILCDNKREPSGL
jgi:hypothetical protein